MISHELGEYQTRRLAWPDPSPADRRLADALEDGGRRVRIRWLADGQAEVSTYSWIGVIQFEGRRISIVPKACGGNLGVLDMLDYASGINALRDIDAQRNLATDGVHLRDLVCQLLSRASDRILGQGPARDYVTREDALAVIRGRLLGDRQICRRFGQLDQLECRYDEFESDTLDNQILAAGLTLAARTATATSVRAFARRVASDYATLCDPIDLDTVEAATRLNYTRSNENYRDAHYWSLLLLRRSALGDLYDNRGTSAPVFLLDMNRLFEDFVTRLVKDAMAGSHVQVRSQARNRSILTNEVTGRPYGAIIPDLLLTRGIGAAIWRRVVDAKYKLYSERKLDPGDIYQALIYAQTLSRPGPGSQLPATILIHPGIKGTQQRILARDAHGLPAARVRTVAVDGRARAARPQSPHARLRRHRPGLARPRPHRRRDHLRRQAVGHSRRHSPCPRSGRDSQ